MNPIQVRENKTPYSTFLRQNSKKHYYFRGDWLNTVLETIKKSADGDLKQLSKALSKIKTLPFTFSVEDINKLISGVRPILQEKKRKAATVAVSTLPKREYYRCFIDAFRYRFVWHTLFDGSCAEIQDPKFILELMKKGTEYDPWNLTKLLKVYRIESEWDRIEIAKAIAKRDGWLISNEIELFDINKEKDRIDIAKIAFSQSSVGIALCFKNYRIQNPQVCLEFCRMSALKYPNALIDYLSDFKIPTKEVLIEILISILQNAPKESCIDPDKFCVTHGDKEISIDDEESKILIAESGARYNGEAVSSFIDRYKIQDQKSLERIAKLSAQNDGGATSLYIHKYGIKSQKTLQEIAMLAARRSGKGVSENIQNYGIDSQKARIKIAEIALRNHPKETSENIGKYMISEESERIRLAKKCAKIDGGAISLYIAKYGITDQSALAEIALIAAKSDGDKVAENIKNYAIKNVNDRFAIFLQCLSCSLKPANVLICLDDFGFSNDVKFQKGRVWPVYGLFLIAKNCMQNEETPYHILIDAIESYIVSEWKGANFSFFRRLILDLLNVNQKNELLIWFLYLLGMIAIREAPVHRIIEMSEHHLFGKIAFYHDSSMKYTFTNCLVSVALSKSTFAQWKIFNELSFAEHAKLPNLLLARMFKHGLEQNILQDCVKRIHEERSFRNFPNHRLLCFTLEVVMKAKNLRAEDKTNLLKIVTPSEGKPWDHRLLQMIQSILLLRPQDLRKERLLSINNDLKQAFDHAFKRTLSFEGIEGFSEKFERTFNTYLGNQEALLVYAANLNQLVPIEKSIAIPFLRQYIKQVLNDTFFSERYSTAKNPHLAKVFEKNALLKNEWMRGGAFDLNKIGSNLEKPYEALIAKQDGISCLAYFKEIILNEKCLPNEEYPHLISFLEGKQPKEDLLIQLQSITQSKMMPLDERRKAQLQMKCIQCTVSRNILVALRNIEDLAYKLPKVQDFADEITRVIIAIQNYNKKRDETCQGWEVADTDDPYDLFLCGTEIHGSCLSAYGNPNFSKCLLEYLLDGKNRMIAIKNPDGKICARAIFRILWSETEKKPILFLEKIYSRGNMSEEYRDAILTVALKRAKVMGLKLLSKDLEIGKPYLGLAVSLGAVVPFEYVDAEEGIPVGGKYVITGAHIISD